MDEETMTCCALKKNFIDRVSYAISGQHRISVMNVDYQVFETKEGYAKEYLVVTYKGGAIAARNVNGDSQSAMFREIAKMIDGGYYAEVEDYRKVESSCKRII